jgi:hypothetical protein
MRLATPGRTSGRWRHIARSFRSDEERDRARLPDEDVRGRAVLFSRSERTLAQFDTGFEQSGPHALAVAAVGPVEVRELPLYDEGGHAAHRNTLEVIVRIAVQLEQADLLGIRNSRRKLIYNIRSVETINDWSNAPD